MNFFSIIGRILSESGWSAVTWQQMVMLLVSFVLMYLAVKKEFEPLLLLPISFGIFLANIPLANLMIDATAEGRAWTDSGLLRIFYYGNFAMYFPASCFWQLEP
jgi:Na+-transporting methylmalonyl-CoA/oxaloacetate decarboxylase beta subunit